MKPALVLLAGLLAGCTALQPVQSRTGALPWDTIITITDAPCDVKQVLDAIKDEYHASFRAGSAKAPDGETRRLCWMPSPQRGDRILVLDEKLEAGEIPVAIFGEKI